MQNKKGKGFTTKKGAMVILSLCLVGGAAFTTYYTIDRADKAKEEKQRLMDLNAEIREEARAEVEKEKASEAQKANAADAKADLPLANEMDVDPATLVKEEETEPVTEMETEEAVDVSSANIQPTVAFDDSIPLTWPVAGNVLLDYSMDSTVYFPTLDQYKYNPALIIGAETGGQVVAAARGIVESVDVNEETGTTLTLDLGNEYELVYGQLKEVTAEVGEVVETGQLLGYVSEPTKYYCEEGSNLYFEMKKDGVPVDPFLYLDGE